MSTAAALHHHHQQQQPQAMDPSLFYSTGAFQPQQQAFSSQVPTPYPTVPSQQQNAAAADLYSQMLLSAAAAAAQQMSAAAAADHHSATSSSADANAMLTMNAAAILAAHALSASSPMWSQGGSNSGSSSFIGTPTFNQGHAAAAAAASYGQFQQNNGFSGSFGSGGHQQHHGFSGMMMPAAAAPQAPKRYSHNPYASDPSTPTTPMLGASFSSSSLHAAAPVPSLGVDGLGGASSAAFAHQQQQHGFMFGADAYGQQQQQQHNGLPQHLPNGSDPNGAFGINEQFAALKGGMANAACTPRGRHVLIAAIRLQQPEKLQAIADELLPSFAAVVADANGSHVVRTLFEFLSEEQSAQLLMSLSADAILALATFSQHSRRVLQAALERHRHTAATTLQPIVDVIARQAPTLATTQQGCIAVMRVVENATDAQKIQILQTVRADLSQLTTDPYGNYVVQTLVQNLPRDMASEVIDKAFEGHFVSMCCNKFASNVMEKIVHAATPPTRKMILDEICFNNASLQMVMQDGFGNFVLQAIIDTCTTGCEYRKLCDRIRPLLSCSPYGHKIEAKLRSKRFNSVATSGH